MEGGEAGVMAVTKVFAIRVRLDDRVRYITDGEKTSLSSSITYISNPEKTEQFFFLWFQSFFQFCFHFFYGIRHHFGFFLNHLPGHITAFLRLSAFEIHFRQ